MVEDFDDYDGFDGWFCDDENCNDPTCGYDPEFCLACAEYQHACHMECSEAGCSCHGEEDYFEGMED